jgi:hypothetical protein
MPLPQPDLVPQIGRERAYRLDSPWKCDLPYLRCVLEIDSGFDTDGASIPWLLRPLIGQPFDPNFIAPALAHDALYRAHLCTRSQADAELRELMQLNGPVASAKNWRFWCGVRVGGWVPWLMSSADDIAEARVYCRLA